MRRFAVLVSTAVFALLVTGLVSLLPALGGAQEASPAADMGTPTQAQTRSEAEAVAPESEAGAVGVTVDVLGRTGSLLEEQDRHLTLFSISLEPGADVPQWEYVSAQILAVESGSIVLTVLDAPSETVGTVVQRGEGDPCAGDGCDLQSVVNQELLLNPGDSISHDGRVVYAYRYEGASGRVGFDAASAQGRGRATRACANGCG